MEKWPFVGLWFGLEFGFCFVVHDQLAWFVVGIWPFLVTPLSVLVLVLVSFLISACVGKQWFCLYMKTSEQRFDAVKTELPLIPLRNRKLFGLFFGLFHSSIAPHTFEHLPGTPFKIPKWWNFTYFLSSRRVYFSTIISFIHSPNSFAATASSFFVTQTFAMRAEMC